jgi:hypothetical protein
MRAPSPCPCCQAASARLHHQGADRAFWRCGECDLVFVAPQERLTYEAEVARYRHHRNDERDPDYLEFLSRLAHPVIARTPVGARGLDFGSGISPAMANILTESGRPSVAYDPLFRPDAALLAARYDFVTCSEVIEHVHEPFPLLARLEALVQPGGLIGVMTTFRNPAEPFGEWWYARDPTHVCFYSEATMRWIAARFGWALELPAENIVLFAVQMREKGAGDAETAGNDNETA